MFKTRITEMFGIQYPIIGGGMLWLSRAELVAAISNAGGLGILSSATFPTVEEFREEIRKTKRLTNKPFGVNFPLLPTVRPTDMGKFIDVVIDEGIKIVETAGRNPEPYMKHFKDGGIKVIHKTPAVRFAKTAERAGVDAVAILGCEGAGHVGLEYVTSMFLIPQAVNSLRVPVIAAGGIGDARGFVAALALGAGGVLMGTRFMASEECLIHPTVKDWLMKARETDTMLVQQSIKNTARVIKNKPAEKTVEMEQKGASLEELLPVISGLKEKEGFETGNLDAGIMHCGQAVGLIQEIPTVKEIIDGIISEAKSICCRLQQAAEA